MNNNFEKLKENIEKLKIDLKKIKSYQELDNLKNMYLGKNSHIKNCLKELTAMNEENKKKYGKVVHSHLHEMEELFQNFKLKVADFDCTLPIYYKVGEENILRKTIKEIMDLMTSMNFTFFAQEDIIDEWKCFDSLNINSHPCRDVFQSFFIQTTNKKNILSPHTSTIQNFLLSNYEELKAFSIGSVFRRDSDRTHSPMFHQMEVMVLNDTSNMRSSFFPFTSPSMEVDILWNNQWLEIGGCGIIHPNVLKLANRKEYEVAYAVGIGVDRLAMIKYNCHDIRSLYSY